jgi:hypothetical protein
VLVDRDYLNESDVWDNFAYPVWSSMPMPETLSETTGRPIQLRI